MPPHPPPDLAEAIASADARRRELTAGLAGRRAALPLRYWRQQAHYTTPAADAVMALKALESGTGPMAGILERFDVSPAELAERLGVDGLLVDDLLAEPERAPLVMLDGEDAQALRADVSAVGLRNAAAILGRPRAGEAAPAPLRFFRPPGFNLETTVHDLYSLLWALAETDFGDAYPLDGIIFPKLEQPEEVDLLDQLLATAEAALGLRTGTIKVGLLVESGWCAAQLPEIARRAAPRLCALIFGSADYSADVGLAAIADDHPLADWVRTEIVAVAGAVGVPAIDGMTLDYPVADPRLDGAANRERFLERMAQVYGDALRAREFGMLGKWVGHPAQLFAVLLAFRAGLQSASLEAEVAKIDSYRRAVDDDARGAIIIDGVMSDRATDRHARVVLRQATALGRFDPDRALALGVIGADEIDEARRAAGTKREG
jgi:citrate lyase beta subunit